MLLMRWMREERKEGRLDWDWVIGGWVGGWLGEFVGGWEGDVRTSLSSLMEWRKLEWSEVWDFRECRLLSMPRNEEAEEEEDICRFFLSFFCIVAVGVGRWSGWVGKKSNIAINLSSRWADREGTTAPSYPSTCPLTSWSARLMKNSISCAAAAAIAPVKVVPSALQALRMRCFFGWV